MAVQQDRVESGAEDVVLALVEGAVTDPHGRCSRISGEVISSRLGQVPATVDPVHDLECAVLVRLELADELHELVGLPVQVQVMKGLEGEGRVPDPGEAVIPISLPSRRLRQRGRQGRHRRARGHVGEPLDRERRAVDRFSEAVVRHSGLGDPRAPVAGRLAHACVRLVHVLR